MTEEEDEMLILTRRVGESLTIGEDVTVTVLGVKGSQVRIGIDAPAKVPIHRQEVHDRIRERTADRRTGAKADEPGATC